MKYHAPPQLQPLSPFCFSSGYGAGVVPSCGTMCGGGSGQDGYLSCPSGVGYGIGPGLGDGYAGSITLNNKGAGYG